MATIHGLRPVPHAITYCGRSLSIDRRGTDTYFNGAHNVVARKEATLVTCRKCLDRMRQGALL